jgi:sorting nexin-1/2
LKVYQAQKTAEQNLIKARIALEKARLKDKVKPEQLAQHETEIKDAEARVEKCKQDYQLVTSLLKSELERFEHEKIDDVSASLKNFLKTSADNHKKVEPQLINVSLL